MRGQLLLQVPKAAVFRSGKMKDLPAFPVKNISRPAIPPHFSQRAELHPNKNPAGYKEPAGLGVLLNRCEDLVRCLLNLVQELGEGDCLHQFGLRLGNIEIALRVR